MKLKLFTLISLLTAFQGAAQVKERKAVDNFTSVVLEGSGNVIFTEADSFSVFIESDEKANLESATTKTENGALLLKSTGKGLTMWRVTGKNVGDFVIQGRGNITIRNSTAPNLRLRTSGSGNFKAKDLTAESVKAEILGSGGINVKGKANSLSAHISGAGNINAFGLETDTSSVIISGSGNVKVNSKRNVDIKISGSGNVFLLGDAAVTKSISGSGKIKKVEPEENSQGTHSDTTSFSMGKSKVIIYGDEKKKHHAKHKNKHPNHGRRDHDDEKDWDHDKHPSHGPHDHDDDHDNDEEGREHETSFHHWQGIDFGLNSYVNANNDFNIGHDFLEINQGRSFKFALNLLEKDIHLYKNYVNLVTGLGFEWNSYSFSNPFYLNPNQQTVSATVDSVASFSKNKLKITWVTVPLLLDFNSSDKPDKSFHLAAGVVGGYRIGSKTKHEFKIGDREYESTMKDDFNLSPFKLDATVRFGFGGFTVFANYGLTTLFKSNKGPAVYPVSAGISWTGW